MTPAEIRKYKNLGAEAERKAFRRIVRKAKANLQTILVQLDKHVAAVSKRKGGLGRK